MQLIDLSNFVWARDDGEVKSPFTSGQDVNDDYINEIRRDFGN